MLERTPFWGVATYISLRPSAALHLAWIRYLDLMEVMDTAKDAGPILVHCYFAALVQVFGGNWGRDFEIKFFDGWTAWIDMKSNDMPLKGNASKNMAWHYMIWDEMRWDEMRWAEMGWDGMRWDEMRWDGMRWDGMRWDEMGWDEMGWDEMGWEEMRWREMRWHEIRWHEMTNDLKQN